MKNQPEDASMLYRQGRQAMEENDLSSAIRLLEESSRLDPHFKTLELLGECLIKRGQYLEAILPLAASAGLGTRAFRALYLLAQALHGIGRRADAVEKLSQALEMKPDYKAAKALLESLRASS